MLVKVTEQDIAKGIAGDCLRDPIALALRRITGLPWRVEQLYCYPDTKGRRPHQTPRQVNRFIEDFDNGKPVQPFEFELR